MRLWQGAGLRRDEDLSLERSTGWLELFSDLVFVVIVARLAHGLAAHVGGHEALTFVLAFVGVFWVWNAFTYYAERFECEGLDHRLLSVAGMVPVVAMAVWAEDALGHNYVGFVVAYLAARAVNIAAWVRAGAREAVFRPVALRFALGFALVTAVLVIGMVVTDPTLRIVLWIVAVILDVCTPFATVAAQSALPALSSSKFPERFGLLTMIVLGESVTGVVGGVSGLHDAGDLDAAGLVQGLLGLLIGVALAWTYYDFVARRPPRPVFLTALGWVHLHMVAIAGTGAGISANIAATALGEPQAAPRQLLVLAAAVALLALAALETTLVRGPDEFTHPRWSPGLKVLVAVVLLGVGLVDLGWSTTGLLAMVLVALLVPVIYGVSVWARAEPSAVVPGADDREADQEQGARP